jgi:hypothetical protein
VIVCEPEVNAVLETNNLQLVLGVAGNTVTSLTREVSSVKVEVLKKVVADFGTDNPVFTTIFDGDGVIDGVGDTVALTVMVAVLDGVIVAELVIDAVAVVVVLAVCEGVTDALALVLIVDE